MNSKCQCEALITIFTARAERAAAAARDLKPRWATVHQREVARVLQDQLRVEADIWIQAAEEIRQALK